MSRRHRRRLAAALPTLVALTAAPMAGAGDILGERLYRERGCVLCHGPEGREPADAAYPVLAGQRRAYLAQQLRDLRSGLRSNGRTGIMREFVERLDDAQIDALAGWLSTRSPCAPGHPC